MKEMLLVGWTQQVISTRVSLARLHPNSLTLTTQKDVPSDALSKVQKFVQSLFCGLQSPLHWRY
jgi:hypothetical protein